MLISRVGSRGILLNRIVTVHRRVLQAQAWRWRLIRFTVDWNCKWATHSFRKPPLPPIPHRTCFDGAGLSDGNLWESHIFDWIPVQNRFSIQMILDKN